MSFWKKTKAVAKKAKEIAKHYSTQALVVAGSIPSVWLSVPEEVKVLIPAPYMAAITAFVATAGVVGKLIPQGKPEEKEAVKVIDEVKGELADFVKENGSRIAVSVIKKAVTK